MGYMGQPLKRREDQRFLQGAGRYVDDIVLPNMAWCAFVRSPHAHAEILGTDTSAASNLPGVLDIFTGEDIAADNLGVPGMPAKWLRPDGQPMKYRPQPPLALGRVRYVGDPVALIVASFAVPPWFLTPTHTWDVPIEKSERIMGSFVPWRLSLQRTEPSGLRTTRSTSERERAST